MRAIERAQQLVERAVAELKDAHTQAAKDAALANGLGGMLDDLKRVDETASVIWRQLTRSLSLWCGQKKNINGGRSIRDSVPRQLAESDGGRTLALAVI